MLQTITLWDFPLGWIEAASLRVPERIEALLYPTTG